VQGSAITLTGGFAGCKKEGRLGPKSASKFSKPSFCHRPWRLTDPDERSEKEEESLIDRKVKGERPLDEWGYLPTILPNLAFRGLKEE